MVKRSTYNCRPFDRFQIYYSRIDEQWKLIKLIEPLLLFESIMVEDRSIMLLVDSNYSYRSDEMQSWYNDDIPLESAKKPFNTNSQTFTKNSSIEKKGGYHFSRNIDNDSKPLRTSPIRRGAWVATVIFNKPPPPPDIILKLNRMMSK